MAKINVNGSALVILSSFSFDNLKKIQKRKPEALCLVDDKGNTTFKVGVTEPGQGNISKYGISFDSASYDESHRANLTMCIPSNVENIYAFIDDVIGSSITKLNHIEEGLALALAEVEAEQQLVRDSVTVL